MLRFPLWRVIGITIFLFLFFVGSVYAQDVPPAPTSPENFFTALVQLILSVTYIPSAGLGVVVFTSAIAWVALNVLGIELSGFWRQFLAVVVQVVVWVVFTFAANAGLLESAQNILDVAVKIIMALGTLSGGLITQHVVYEFSKNRQVPIAGFTPKYVKGTRAYDAAHADRAAA